MPFNPTTSPPSTTHTVHQPDPNSSKLNLMKTPIQVPAHPSNVLIKVAITAPCLREL